MLRPGAEEQMVLSLGRRTCQRGPEFLGVGFLPGVLRLKEAPPHCLDESGRWVPFQCGRVWSGQHQSHQTAGSKRLGEPQVQGDVSRGCPATVRTLEGIQVQGESRWLSGPISPEILGGSLGQGAQSSPRKTEGRV